MAEVDRLGATSDRCSRLRRQPLAVGLRIAIVMFGCLAVAACQKENVAAPPPEWAQAWPQTDFERTSVAWDEFTDGGPGKDGIQSIDEPRFLPANEKHPLQLGEQEPVISISIGTDARAYPLRILTAHEIVNDRIGDLPIAVTLRGGT